MLKLYVRKANYRKNMGILNTFAIGPNSNTNSVRIFVSYLIETGVISNVYSDKVGVYIDANSLIPFKGAKFASLNQSSYNNQRHGSYDTLSLQSAIYNMGGEDSSLDIYYESFYFDRPDDLLKDEDELLECYMDSIVNILSTSTKLEKKEVLDFVSRWLRAPKNTTEYDVYGSGIESVFVSKIDTSVMFLIHGDTIGYNFKGYETNLWSNFVKIFKQIGIRSMYFTANSRYFGEGINYAHPDESENNPIIPKMFTPVLYTQEASSNRKGEFYNPIKYNQQAYYYYDPSGIRLVENGFVKCILCEELVRLSFSEFVWLRKKGFKPSTKCAKCRKSIKKKQGRRWIRKYC